MKDLTSRATGVLSLLPLVLRSIVKHWPHQISASNGTSGLQGISRRSNCLADCIQPYFCQARVWVCSMYMTATIAILMRIVAKRRGSSCHRIISGPATTVQIDTCLSLVQQAYPGFVPSWSLAFFFVVVDMIRVWSMWVLPCIC